jgi:Uma2 family endonuclease
MPSSKPRELIAIDYEAWAQEYLRSLPLEHFMEATGQAKQREITLESLALLKARRSDVHVFNELLIQYPIKGERRPGQVVPDNMVIVTDQPIHAKTSFNYPLETARPFWMLEYVSNSNKRKDYFDNFDKYEKELKVPYFLMFHPEEQKLTLYRHTGKKYILVNPNSRGRLEIPELELELAIFDGWVRYWLQGELLALPGEMLQELDKFREAIEEAERRTEEEKRRAEKATQRANSEMRRAEEEKRRAEEEKRRADDAVLRADEQTRQTAEYRLRVEEMERELQILRERKNGNGAKTKKHPGNGNGH